MEFYSLPWSDTLLAHHRTWVSLEGGVMRERSQTRWRAMAEVCGAALGDINCSKISCDDGCTALCVTNVTDSHILKRVNFMICGLYLNKDVKK